MSVKKNLKENRGLQLIAGGTLWADCPIGTINAYGGTTAPEGWLLCQGQALSRTEYADLFAIIGTNFGSGDGSTTFNLPDLRGEFLRGAGANGHANQGSGGSVGQHQDATENIYTYVGDGEATNDLGIYQNSDFGNGYHEIYPQNPDSDISGTEKSKLALFQRTSQSTSSMKRQYYTSRPTNTSVNYIMKAKQTPIPADLEAALEARNLLTFG